LTTTPTRCYGSEPVPGTPSRVAVRLRHNRGVNAWEPSDRQDEEKLEFVKRMFDAFATRDLDAALSGFHSEVRLWVITGSVTRAGRPYIGHAGIREYWRDTDRLWRELELFPTRFGLVDDAVVVHGEVRSRGTAGSVERSAVWTWKFSDGLVVDCRVDSDLQAARAALGEARVIEETLHAYHDAFNRRDVDVMVSLTHPSVVNRPVAISHARREYLGHQGLREWMSHVRAAEHGQRVAPHEVRQLEPGRWALLGQFSMAGAGDSPFASLAAIDDGLITEVRDFLSEETILRALRYIR
jgi:ketosteroid isomerase-like protein